jgi:hypothetical protein
MGHEHSDHIYDQLPLVILSPKAKQHFPKKDTARVTLKFRAGVTLGRERGNTLKLILD